MGDPCVEKRWTVFSLGMVEGSKLLAVVEDAIDRRESDTLRIEVLWRRSPALDVKDARLKYV
jgi:hypothetical protein